MTEYIKLLHTIFGIICLILSLYIAYIGIIKGLPMVVPGILIPLSIYIIYDSRK